MSEFHAIFKVTPGLQSYEWGKKGSDSLAAQMAKECVEGFKVDEGKEYAEVRTRRVLASPSLTYTTALDGNARHPPNLR